MKKKKITTTYCQYSEILQRKKQLSLLFILPLSYSPSWTPISYPSVHFPQENN